MRLEPFKVRRGEADKAIGTAMRVFGQPAEFTQGWTSADVRWHFYDEGLVRYALEIGFHNESDTLSIKVEATRTTEDQTVCGRVVGKSTERLIRQFVEEVRKPWKEWSEEEIMSSPMWACLYKSDGNPPTPAMDTMMVMNSFRSPDSPWVKRYFKGATT